LLVFLPCLVCVRRQLGLLWTRNSLPADGIRILFDRLALSANNAGACAIAVK
jgi:hypothetical protein